MEGRHPLRSHNPNVSKDMTQLSANLPTAQAETTPSVHRSILVVGGGIAGITAAVEAAEVGYDVYLIEKEAY